MVSTTKIYPVIKLEDTDVVLAEHVRTTDMRYTNFKTLAKGGKCLIQTCKDNYLNRIICYKSLLKKYRNNKVERIRFLREARITALLQHPTTIPVYNLGRDNQGDYFFTMKKVEGYTLREIIFGLKNKNEKMVKQFKLNHLLQAVLQLAYGMDYAHSHGVIHRDIKPENISIGTFGEVVLLDWGLAKVWGMQKDLSIEDQVKNHINKINRADISSATLTQGGNIEATPLYMSPEQINDASQVDYQTDIYSLGAVIYEILTLNYLISGENLIELKKNILNHEIVVPSKKSPNRIFSKKWDSICLKCLAKNKNNRYQTMKQVISDIKKA